MPILGAERARPNSRKPSMIPPETPVNRCDTPSKRRGKCARSVTRRGKIESIRRQLAENTYDLDGALDLAMERILVRIDR